MGPMIDSPVVEARDLSFSYRDRKALQGITFQVGRAEIFGLLGPNGGGKTTLFRILSTLLRPGGGLGRVGGHDLVKDPVAVRRCIGVVFQSPSLDGKLTVLENLRHQGHLFGLRGQVLQARIDEMLSRIGPADRARDRVETLSGGLQRRVEVAKGLLHRPSVLLLDEPTSHLDPGVRRDLWDVLRGLRDRDGVTILLTTHLMEEAERCDRIGILDRGELIAAGAPEALKEEIGGGVIRVQTRYPEALAAEIREQFGAEPTLVDDEIRIEQAHGHAFAARLLEAFPSRIDALTLGRPTLEDVFLRRTGRSFLDKKVPAGTAEKGRK